MTGTQATGYRRLTTQTWLSLLAMMAFGDKMFGICPVNPKVVGAIVCRVVIQMMYALRRRQWSPQHRLRDKQMFQHITIRSRLG